MTVKDNQIVIGDEKPKNEYTENESVVLEKGGVVNNADYTGAEAKTDPAEIRLVRKIDWRLMPTLCIMYFLNYVDRNAIAQARLNNLEEDLNMTGVQFNTTVSM